MKFSGFEWRTSGGSPSIPREEIQAAVVGARFEVRRHSSDLYVFHKQGLLVVSPRSRSGSTPPPGSALILGRMPAAWRELSRDRPVIAGLDAGEIFDARGIVRRGWCNTKGNVRYHRQVGKILDRLNDILGGVLEIDETRPE